MVLFIGDGMAPSMISAARYISKKTSHGKFGDNFLEIEKLGTIGKIATNGIESILTDSANSAATYASGHKSWANALNVYSDTSDDTLDDPKVETITEYIRRTRNNMCIGVVSTAEIQDATPAAFFSHTRRRSDYPSITDQMINQFKPTTGNMTWDPKPVRPDVVLGGGAATFCVKTNSTPSCNNKVDYFDIFAKAGYQVVKSKDQLAAVKNNAPVLGLFHTKNMDTWLDRNVYTSNLATNKASPDGTGASATNQPGLYEMTMTAIEVMSKKCSDGFFLMSEAASIDKAMHPMDYDRGLADLLELDRTVGAVNTWAKKNGDNTGIIVTADHAQAYDVYATVDTQYFNSLPIDDKNILGDADAGLQVQKRLSIAEATQGGWPDLVVDENGVPNKWEGRYRLVSGKVDGLDARENWQTRKSMRVPALTNAALSAKFGFSVAAVNPAEPAGVRKSPTLPPDVSSTVHSLQAVDIYCSGPWYFRRNCARVMDNTELFFVMADALGLGYSPSNPKTRDC
ncbi:alkaline-phosphatase-like protein [Entophlyctis helioformis]|nr:alkaline-phosphatase-like protein [Entophlyctis helioformis]